MTSQQIINPYLYTACDMYITILFHFKLHLYNYTTRSNLIVFKVLFDTRPELWSTQCKLNSEAITLLCTPNDFLNLP